MGKTTILVNDRKLMPADRRIIHCQFSYGLRRTFARLQQIEAARSEPRIGAMLGTNGANTRTGPRDATTHANTRCCNCRTEHTCPITLSHQRKCHTRLPDLKRERYHTGFPLGTAALLFVRTKFKTAPHQLLVAVMSGITNAMCPVSAATLSNLGSGTHDQNISTLRAEMWM